MPGANCSIFGCNVSRKSGISIFKIPGGNDEFNTLWREKLIGIITRDRVKDDNLKRQILNRSLFICERHYLEEQKIRNDRNTTLIPNSIPQLNLPKKSIPNSSTIVKPRKSADSILEKRTITTPLIVKDCYTSYKNFCNGIKLLKFEPKWSFDVTDNFTNITKSSIDFSVPEVEIYIYYNLTFMIRILTWLLPASHDIYIRFSKTMKNVKLQHLIAAINNHNICAGLPVEAYQKIVGTSTAMITHCIPHKFDPTIELTDMSPLNQHIFYRSSTCTILTNNSICHDCSNTESLSNKKEQQKVKRKLNKVILPAKSKAPISNTSAERLKLTIQTYRIENKELHGQIEKLQTALTKSSVPVSNNLNNDFLKIISSTDRTKMAPFMRLFWDEQQKYISSSKTGIRYHPMVIRYCLALASKSPAAYEELRYDDERGTGVLILPSRRRLRDYKNYIRPERGFNKLIIKELIKKTENLSDIEKFVVLLFDEMKIQENLVWCKHSGELIGFVDLGDDILNAATIKEQEAVASHVLVFLIRSIVNPFKFSFANFATTGATSTQLFPIFWKAVYILERTCKLKVVATTCDGASPNRKFFRMHDAMTKEEDINIDVDVTYKTLNKCSFDEKRFIYFIADPPHLIKTARNSLANSGSGICTRFMWNNEKYLLWNHISEMFYLDHNCGLKFLPRLTYDHIKLTSYSVMNVRLAAQVLSKSMSIALSNHHNVEEATETAKFCYMMDSFFDIVNIKNFRQGSNQLKPFLVPFSSVNDDRFRWLENDFLNYFKEWLQNIHNRQGNYTDNAKANMFVAWQTHEGLKITAHSIIEVVKYLLSNGVSYVLTERFCQDPLENYFGRQRSMGARKDNPSLRDVGYNDNTIRNQKVFRPINGNVQPDDYELQINDDPLPCRKKPRK